MDPEIDDEYELKQKKAKSTFPRQLEPKPASLAWFGFHTGCPAHSLRPRCP